MSARQKTLRLHAGGVEAVVGGASAILLWDQRAALRLPAARDRRLRITVSARGRYEPMRGTRTGGLAAVLTHYEVYDHVTDSNRDLDMPRRSAPRATSAAGPHRAALRHHGPTRMRRERKVYTANAELCLFFLDMGDQFGYVTQQAGRLLMPKQIETALRTMAPAVVPASRCAPGFDPITLLAEGKARIVARHRRAKAAAAKAKRIKKRARK